MTQMLDRPAAVLMPLGRYEWERLVRRIVMPPQHKLVALLLATWADPDGSRVRPGTALLAGAMARSERTASEVVRSLARDWGLIEQTSRGGGRGGKGKTTDYRLTIPTDLLDRHRLLDPMGLPDSPEVQASGHSEVSSEALASGHSVAPRESPEAQASGQSTPEPVDNSVSPEVQASDENDFHRKSDAVTDGMTGNFQRLTGSSALPTTNHIPNHLETTNTSVTYELNHQTRDAEPTSRNDLGGLVGERPAGPSTLDELLPRSKPSKPAPGPKCDRHPLMAGGVRDDGQSACPLCRRAAGAPP